MTRWLVQVAVWDLRGLGHIEVTKAVVHLLLIVIVLKYFFIILILVLLLRFLFVVGAVRATQTSLVLLFTDIESSERALDEHRLLVFLLSSALDVLVQLLRIHFRYRAVQGKLSTLISEIVMIEPIQEIATWRSCRLWRNQTGLSIAVELVSRRPQVLLVRTLLLFELRCVQSEYRCRCLRGLGTSGSIDVGSEALNVLAVQGARFQQLQALRRLRCPLSFQLQRMLAILLLNRKRIYLQGQPFIVRSLLSDADYPGRLNQILLIVTCRFLVIKKLPFEFGDSVRSVRLQSGRWLGLWLLQG